MLNCRHHVSLKKAKNISFPNVLYCLINQKPEFIVVLFLSKQCLFLSRVEEFLPWYRNYLTVQHLLNLYLFALFCVQTGPSDQHYSDQDLFTSSRSKSLSLLRYQLHLSITLDVNDLIRCHSHPYQGFLAHYISLWFFRLAHWLIIFHFWKYLECTDTGTNTGRSYSLKGIVQRDSWCHLIGLHSRVRCENFTNSARSPILWAFLWIRNYFIRIQLSMSLRIRLRVRILP
jgi:hypothetical protein